MAIKDPTIVYYNGKWQVYASTVNTSGQYSMVYLNFADFSEAANAPQYFLSSNPAFGNNYHCAPQLFYFRPQNKWYLIYQSGPPQYSTTDDPTKPDTWTAPQSFFSATPDIVLANQGAGGWLDYWIICDDANCYLFFADDNGHWYRAQTTIQNFPNGFGNTTIALQEANKNDLFEASNVYKLKGTNKYLAMVECIGPTGQRYFRSWTADTLDGQWTPLLASWDKPFLGTTNVTFDSAAGAWTGELSHGEMLRDGYDETMTVDPCHMQFLYQGVEIKKEIGAASYNAIPWKLGLAIQTN
jgi:endo-1,4-beta-xylanase